MAPLSTPELLETLNDRPTPITEDQAAQNLAPTDAYIRALANQFQYWSDPSLNLVDPKDKKRFAVWFSNDRTKPTSSETFAVLPNPSVSSSSSRHGGGKPG